MTVFAHFPGSTNFFGEGALQALINFRVDSLEELLAQLAAENVHIDPNCRDNSYGLPPHASR